MAETRQWTRGEFAFYREYERWGEEYVVQVLRMSRARAGCGHRVLVRRVEDGRRFTADAGRLREVGRD